MGLRDNIEKYIGEGVSSYHTPGHKGILPAPLTGIAPYDLTELEETGSLYDGSDLFLEIEERFEEFYHSGATILSGGGCTLAIQTMLTLYCKPGDSVIFSRTAHRSGVSVAGLLDLKVHWLYPDQYRGAGLAGTPSEEALQQALLECPNCRAVYITSPDYFGCTTDLQRFSAVCKERGIPLLVDNAHGSHLIYFGKHPLQLGATACADSLHKTMPVMTGGAVLHLRDNTCKERARRMMPLYGSTSPSYPILLSMELCGENLGEIGELYSGFAEEVAELRDYATRQKLLACNSDDPLRVVLRHNASEEIAKEILTELKIAPELLKGEHIILLCSPATSLQKLYLLCDRLAVYGNGTGESFLRLPRPEKAMTIRDALFASVQEIPLEMAQGRIAAEVIAPCPPGIPITIPGEVIDSEIIFLLKKYSVNQLFVVE